MSVTPENSDPSGSDLATRDYRDAFAVADELNVHGSGCVCPTCAARLPGLLMELARALGNDAADR
ncbi:hypothetical protein Acsp06_49990 [Actinomycetospora sp. NBRC 106375]|uniref:hypothetical protein n=1 Tax=Actinomycetospora sp. NBRC 106375 TaxID=3032207 RepID=UPI0024A32D88|nr:hypothetical protein [Actinomycetospora sp. NBRC 106375]GLZ48814.1 hypothetical protein Acsp06_49990 [Actinomycetospora sp. NBRC 106375]